MLTVDASDDERLLVRFNNSQTKEFGAFASAGSAVQKGESPDDAAHDRAHDCPKCGFRYPNQDCKICPRCVDKHGLFLRVLGYLRLYRGIVISVALTMVLSSGFRTIAPLC